MQTWLTLWRHKMIQTEQKREYKWTRNLKSPRKGKNRIKISKMSYLFFNKALKSSSPESSFPSVLLQIPKWTQGFSSMSRSVLVWQRKNSQSLHIWPKMECSSFGLCNKQARYKPAFFFFFYKPELDEKKLLCKTHNWVDGKRNIQEKVFLLESCVLLWLQKMFAFWEIGLLSLKSFKKMLVGHFLSSAFIFNCQVWEASWICSFCIADFHKPISFG